ncbi:hypothetical protein M8C21_011979, partial [Ambrosia artemisiifolia]
LPDTRGSWYNQTMTLVECEKMCKSNCLCTAYANSNKSGTRSGCFLWFGSLIDIRTIVEDGDAIYIRLSSSELVLCLNVSLRHHILTDSIESSRTSSAGRGLRVIILIVLVVLVILVSICLFYCFNRKKQQQQGTSSNKFRHDPKNGSGDEDLELPLFGFSIIRKATNNFSVNNKLGEGGFGPVCKGVLEDGKEIAVKRLAKTSTQGLHEFKNEVIL